MLFLYRGLASLQFLITGMMTYRQLQGTVFVYCLVLSLCGLSVLPGSFAAGTVDDIEKRSERSSQEIAKALAGKYGHGMGSVSYIPALALWGRLRLAELLGGDGVEVVRADVRRIADAAPVPKKWTSGSVVAGHLIYAAIGDQERLLSAAAVGLDEVGKAREFVSGHSDMSDAVFMHLPGSGNRVSDDRE